jgi:hypothetical protein
VAAQTVQIKPGSRPGPRDISVTDLPRLRLEEVYLPEVLLGVQKIPPTEDRAVIDWVKDHFTVLPPSYIYDASQRLWRHDRDTALEWFAIGSLRARYDAFRCKDETSRQGILILPSLAPDISKNIDAHRAAFGEAGLRALRREDVFSDAVSPMWICLHGMRAINEAIQGRPLNPADQIYPASEWPGIRERLRAEYTTYFIEQGKPQDDPFASTTKPLPYIQIASGIAVGGDDFGWLDGSTLVYLATQKDTTGKSSRRLYSWSPNTGVTAYEPISGFGGLCASDGRLLIRTRTERRDGKSIMTYEEGSLAKRDSKEIAGEDIPLWPSSAHTFTGTSSANKSPIKLDRFGCGWVQNEKVASMGTQWLPLHEGHGFLRWTSAATSGVGSLQWLPTELGDPLTLPIDSQRIQSHAIRYLASKDAYFISPIWLGREKERTGECAPILWLFPKSRQHEKLCAPDDALGDQLVTFSPSERGLIRALYERRSFHGPKPGGLYLTGSDGKTTRIFESRIRSHLIAPGGCLLAFTHFDGLGTSLGVLDVCRPL